MKFLSGSYKGPIIVLFTAISIFGTSPIMAQEEGALEEIVVTARYREENLQETPLAITALTAADLEVRALSSSYEVAYTVPNASFRPAQAAFGNTMTAFIRGIGQYDFNSAFEPGVGIYIDDVYQPSPMGSMIDLMDLERVEVLRGPQGTLFGRGAIGGAMRMVSKKPQGDNTGSISVTAGENERIDVRASYDFAITKNLFARVTGMSKKRDGYQDRIDFACANPAQAGLIKPRSQNRNNDCKLGTNGGEQVVGTRGSLRWVITNSLEATVSVDYMDDNSESRANTLLDTNIVYGDLTGPGGVPDGLQDSLYARWDLNYVQPTFGVSYDDRFVPDSPYVSYATFDDPAVGLNFRPETSIEQHGVSGKIEWDINESMGVETILAYREQNSNFSNDHDISPLNLQMVDGIQKRDWFTAEIRFNGRAMDRLDYTVGFFHYDGKDQSTQTVSFPSLLYGIFEGLIAVGAVLPFVQYPGVLDGVLVNGDNINEFSNNSVFAHAVFDISDRFAVTGGVRWSKDTKDSQFDNSIVVTTIATEDSHFDYKFGLDFNLTDDLMIYTSTASGYRPQAFNPRPFQITQFVQVDGEEANSYDAGIKADLFDNKLRLNVAGFYVDYKQRIVPVGGFECLADAGGNYVNLAAPGTPGAVTDSLGNTCTGPTQPLTRYENEPGDIYGAEVEAEFRPVDPMTISGTFGYTGWSSADVDNLTAVNPNASDYPIYVPKLNWSVSAAYEIPMVNGAMLTPRIDVYGQSEICTSGATRGGCSEAYELLNARLTWTSPSSNWTAAAGATNLTDKVYYLNKFDLQAFGQPTIEGQPGRPREWYVTVRRNFD